MECPKRSKRSDPTRARAHARTASTRGIRRGEQPAHMPPVAQAWSCRTASMPGAAPRVSKVAIEPFDGAAAKVEIMFRRADAMSLVRIDDQARRNFHGLQRVPIFDRLGRRHFDVALADVDEGWRARLLDRADR